MKRKRIIIKQEKNNLIGYPPYPESEDVYSKFEKLSTTNPNDIAHTKPLTENDKLESITEKGTEHDALGYPMDIPGAELDDQKEAIGSEDEENNYYSIGGDNHDNLEEDNG